MKTERCAVWAGRREDEGFECLVLFGLLEKRFARQIFFLLPV